MLLLKITAKRNNYGLDPQSREVIGELPDDLKYWDQICGLLLECMKRDGVVPQHDDHTIAANQ